MAGVARASVGDSGTTPNASKNVRTKMAVANASAAANRIGILQYSGRLKDKK
jgi:hypothetical protein